MTTTLQELVDDLGYCFSQAEADHFMALVRDQKRDEALKMLADESYSSTDAEMVYNYFRKEAVGDDSDLVELPRERWDELQDHKRDFIARVGRTIGVVYASSYGDYRVGSRYEIKLEQIGQVWEVIARKGGSDEQG